MKINKKWLAVGIAVTGFLAALGLTLYPLVSNYYSQRHASQIHTQYQVSMAEADTAAIDAARAAAQAYNTTLVPGAQEVEAYSSAALEAAAEDYADFLNLTGNGLMGYLSIPKISVELPIYHGTSDATLEIGIGHLLGSSLPIGGESTHSILSGHSGMAGNKMLSDLEEMEIGDVFYLEVLGETLAYQVDQIVTVLPSDTTYLTITQGEDYCTLVTCTPYGINTHRLLVRGTRIPYVEEEKAEQEALAAENTESQWMQQYVKGIIKGVALVAVLIPVIIVFAQLRKKLRKGRGKYEN